MNKILILIVLSVLAAACATGGSSSGGTGSGTATDAATTADSATGGETAAATDTGATPADAAAADSAGADATTAGADTAAGTDAVAGVDAIEPVDTASSGGTFAAALPGLKAKCATCHNPNAKLFFQAENCASCATKAASMKIQITTGKMPQSGMPKLADDQRAAILAWIDGGAKCP
ncbi:MAG: hypothetical protein EXR77_18270 [Myxococcales bacterium]|nr:hypothetical protein [Myxococcales bacterium]